MNNIVQIAGKSLPVREYQGQRVVIINDIATIHRVPPSTVRSNFKRNRNRFIENTDYFPLSGKSDGSKCTIAPNVTKVNVFTETGYLMLVKSMTDDLAWKVQRQLVNLYFRMRAVERSVPKQGLGNENISVGLIAGISKLMKDEYRKILYYRITKGLTQHETGRIIGKSKAYVKYREFEMKEAGIHVPSQSGKRQKLTFAPKSQQLILSN